MRFSSPDNAAIAAAGPPGAGTSTPIRRAVDRSAVAVVETDVRRGVGERASYVRHHGRILAAVRGSRPVVIHSRGTVGTLRRAIALVAALHGRPVRPYNGGRHTTPGTTGFDVVGSRGWLRVEVPEAS